MKNIVKSVIGCVVALSVTAGLFACGKREAAPASAPAAIKQKVGFVVTTMSNPFFVDMTDGAKQEAAKHPNMQLIIQAPEKAADNERQIQIIENLISLKVSAICVVPADSKSVVAAIIKANAAGIPVINIDNKVDTDTATKAGAKIAGYIGSDNFSGGALAGEFVAKKIGQNGKVAILEGVSGVEAGLKRKEGFLDAIKKYPGIQVVASQPADWDREKGLNVFQNIYQANPDLKALFACNDEMALGAIRALKQPRTVVVVGFDATKDAVQSVNNGELDATVAQVPAEMGKQAIAAAASVISGASIPSAQQTPLRLISK